jgi:Primase C terminal 2 (PriCT-2).
MKKVFNPLEWKDKKDSHGGSSEPPIVAPSPNLPKASKAPIAPSAHSLEEEVEALTSAVESASVDIAPDYASWLDLAFALSDALGEGGRSYFHRLSRFYPSYDEREADKQFTSCLRSKGSGITIKTLFHLAKQAGILFPQSPLSPNSPNGETGETEEIRETESSQNSESMPTFSQDIYGLLPDFLTSVINKAKNFEDADLLILGTLTAISACLPNVSGIYAEREVFPNLFLFVSAQASAGKGRLTLCRHLIKPIHDNLKRLYSIEMDEYKTLQNEYSQDKKNREPPIEPPIKTLLIPANSSATSVYQVLNDNGGVGLIFETEGDTLANSFKSDYGNFSDGFRKAFHHEMISYTRRKDREFVELTKPRLSALLSGTPHQILALIPDAENGLFSRFIFYNMNLKLEWRDVFSESTVSLDDYFINLGQQFFQFYQTLQQSHPIRFELSPKQKQQFNSFFATVQEEYANLFGLDIVASVRRLGLITFRLAMILTTLRLMDGKENSDIIVCDDTDFRTVLIMARVLLQHTAHVLSTLPAIDSSSASKSQPANRQFFYDMLPHDFNRSTYLAIAAQLNIPPKTAEKQISRLCEKGLLKHLSQGKYGKP